MFAVIDGTNNNKIHEQAILLFDRINVMLKNNEFNIKYDSNKSVILTKEPTNCNIGYLISKYINGELKTSKRSLQFLNAADRLDHIDNIILPNLMFGNIVISERYYLSNIAYCSEDNDELIWLINLYKNFLIPDIVFFIQDNTKENTKLNNKTLIKNVFYPGNTTLEKVWYNFETLERMNKNGNRLNNFAKKICIIDGNLSNKVLHNNIVDKILNFISN